MVEVVVRSVEVVRSGGPVVVQVDFVDFYKKTVGLVSFRPIEVTQFPSQFSA